jgi:Ca-activated chloride channel family protein
VYKPVLAISLLCATLCLGADTAQDYFHRGAQYYIFNKKEQAKNEVITGLQLFPNDPQLGGLAGLLKKEEEQQKQQQQQQQQDQQEKQDQNQQQQQQQNQSQQNQDKNQQQQQQQAQQKEQQEKQKEQQQQQSQAEQKKQEEQKAQASQGEKSDKGDEKNQDQQAYAAGQMTPEQAERLMDAQKGEEQMLQLKPDKPQDNSRPFKDW